MINADTRKNNKLPDKVKNKRDKHKLNGKNEMPTPSVLGKPVFYTDSYQADLLLTFARQEKRDALNISLPLSFFGKDIWNAYELSWLNEKGKPVVAAAEFTFPCESENMIESKSFKLYLNSLNNTVFKSQNSVEKTLIQDLSAATGASVQVKITPLSHIADKIVRHFAGINLDELDITCQDYTVSPHYLQTEKDRVREIVASDLLKSNCLVTGQPDWGSLQITYTGKKIQHEGLLRYIISFRNHLEFHEHCVERIFTDILSYCAPEKLLVYARYTRRGGLDINPYRANYPVHLTNTRLWRQ